MTMALQQPLAGPVGSRFPSPEMALILRRSALLIAERGWCQRVQFVGSASCPQAASLSGALVWAATGHADTCDVRAEQALALMRFWLDPHGSAPFDNWELLAAWNDAPSRRRAEVVAVLVEAGHRPARIPAACSLPGRCGESH
ncbi:MULTISPECIES: DUF6197 family protein [Streptomyces]|uniref:Uncharacterized protein n=1 Tax=Streptomyces dengpaensis TaxID=2049881 RepID=A0ABN5HXG7_9ACTN|nr:MULTISPECIES: hypothetical protein [Streptomyces]AVH55810.1 hypothetical protein C4B68_08545 [Streptomyces dengpaensis]PIB12064.1 hypothetical protein B1C81_02480 [Streptomyces sp. HG99]